MSNREIFVKIDKNGRPLVKQYSQDTDISVRVEGGEENRVQQSKSSYSVKFDNPNNQKISSVSYDSSISVGFNNQKDYSVKSFKYQITGVQYLKHLLDVFVPETIENGDFLIYDANLDKFVTKKISSGDIQLGNIDAGTF